MIKQTLLVARRELRSYFDQPTAYVLAVAFLGLGLYLSFRSLFAMGRATLRPFFDLLPWLYVVFVPAVAMKSLAEERRSRTLEWLLAQPLSETEIVAGKFLGNWAFVLVTLAGTLPMALGVWLASEADPGIMLAQYAGAVLLAAQMTAVGLWASSMTRNQITAFICGAFACFLLVLIGTPVVQIGLPRMLGAWASQLSVISHFENVARGVVDLRDLLYFASTCGLFLLLAVAALSRERLSRDGGAFRRLRAGAGVIALGVLVLNLLGSHVRGRFDLTRNNLFTLSDGSRQILGDLDDVVSLKLFVSDDLPPEVQLILRDVRDLIADLENASNEMLATEEINPDDDEEAEEEARSLGIAPIEFNVLRDDEFQVKRGYFGLAVTYADEQETIPVLDRADDLEFRLVSSVASMTMQRKPVVAFMTDAEAKSPFHYRAFRQSIADRYHVTSLRIEEDSAGALRPDSIDVLIAAAPAQPVADAVADAVDAYLDAGGAALLLMERHALNAQTGMSTPAETGLEDLLEARGVDAEGDLAFDLRSAENVNVGRQGIFSVIRPYPFWPVSFRGGSHATTRDLENVTFGWAAPFTWEEGDPAVAPLWATTELGGTRPAGSIIDPSLEIPVEQDDLGVQVLAVAVDPALADNGGSGESSRRADAGDESETGDEASADAESEAGDPAPPEARPRGRVVAVGDADFLEDRFVQANPQNAIFAANAVDWLAQDEALIGIRSKDRTPPALVFESEVRQNVFKWASLAGVPLLFVVVGFARVAGRERRAERRWQGQGQGQGGES